MINNVINSTDGILKAYSSFKSLTNNDLNECTPQLKVKSFMKLFGLFLLHKLGEVLSCGYFKVNKDAWKERVEKVRIGYLEDNKLLRLIGKQGGGVDAFGASMSGTEKGLRQKLLNIIHGSLSNDLCIKEEVVETIILHNGKPYYFGKNAQLKRAVEAVALDLLHPTREASEKTIEEWGLNDEGDEPGILQFTPNNPTASAVVVANGRGQEFIGKIEVGDRRPEGIEEYHQTVFRLAKSHKQTHKMVVLKAFNHVTIYGLEAVLSEVDALKQRNITARPRIPLQ